MSLSDEKQQAEDQDPEPCQNCHVYEPCDCEITEVIPRKTLKALIRKSAARQVDEMEQYGWRKS